METFDGSSQELRILRAIFFKTESRSLKQYKLFGKYWEVFGKFQLQTCFFLVRMAEVKLNIFVYVMLLQNLRRWYFPALKRG